MEGLVSKLKGRDFEHAQHGEVEAWLVTEGRDLLRQLAQDHFDLRTIKEPKLAVVVGIEGTTRREVVEDQSRALGMVFGEVDIGRLVYRAPRKGVGNLMPLDLELNLPTGRFSFGLQRLAAFEILRSSFESAHAAILESTGVSVSKGELEDMAAELAVDFELFYSVGSEQARTGLSAILGSPDGIRSPDGLDRTKLLILTTDASGVRVVKADLREATRIAAEKRMDLHEKDDPMPESKQIKLYRRRMAQVCAVYQIARFRRRPEDIICELRHLEIGGDKPVRPRPEQKRVWASVAEDAEPTIRTMFREALLRDPKQEMPWVVVVDGNADQLRIIRRLAKKLNVKVTLILDFIHVAGYVWKAGKAFHPHDADATRRWVDKKLLAILNGKASDVAAGMRRAATLAKYPKSKRKPIDRCCDYLLDHKDMLQYDGYLAEGFPIASGVIEGACRHLMQDRLDLSGATWRLRNAEAVLKLRALKSSGDFDEYWAFHVEEELRRNHLARYKDQKPPSPPATSPARRGARADLRVVR